MNMRTLLTPALLSLLLAACAMPGYRQDPVHDQINAELQQASKQKFTDTTADKEMLPPLATIAPPPLAHEPRFDLSVVDSPAQQVFMALVNDTRYNMLLSPEVSGRITISLKDVTMREALDSIRELYGYEYTIQGNRITILPNTLQTRIFQVNYLDAMRSGETDLSVTSSAIGSSSNTNQSPNGAVQNSNVPSNTQGTSQGTMTQNDITTRVRTTSKNDFWGSLKSALDALVGTEGGRKVIITPTSGVVLVKAMPNEIRAVEHYLRAIQAISDRQVMLEAKIIQVTLNSSFQAGVNWANFNGVTNRISAANLQPGSSLSQTGTISSAVDNVSGTAGVGGSLTSSASTQIGTGFLGLALQTSNFSALLNFLQTQGSVSVLSSPRIATLNNQKAVLKVGTDELYVTGVTTNTSTNVSGTATFSPSVSLQPYFSGIALDVTPQIDDDGNIILHIHPSVSTVAEKDKVIDLGTTFGSITLPLAASAVNESDSIVRARDGYIVAIGGLMSQTGTIDSSGLPGTLGSDIGGLLGQRSRSTQKTELIILIKPTLVKSPGDTQSDIDATTDRIEKMRN